MDGNPVELDEHRGMAAQKSTEIRRRSHEVQADHAALRDRQEEFEREAMTGPSTTWAEAAARARYLIQLYAATPEGRDPYLDDNLRLPGACRNQGIADRIATFEIEPRSAADICRVVHPAASRDGRRNEGNRADRFCGC